ncbi:MAG: zinc-ribbon domain-containing protein [Planctomycetaceae bacterium]|nr:zinc-ribbon domain-containing protein [Planctomycetaceae bacterium]
MNEEDNLTGNDSLSFDWDRLEQESQPCPKCGTSIPDGTLLCPKCGKASSAVGRRSTRYDRYFIYTIIGLIGLRLLRLLVLQL